MELHQPIHLVTAVNMSKTLWMEKLVYVLQVLQLIVHLNKQRKQKDAWIIKHLNRNEMEERRQKALYFNYDELFVQGYQRKKLF